MIWPSYCLILGFAEFSEWKKFQLPENCKWYRIEQDEIFKAQESETNKIRMLFSKIKIISFIFI